MSLKVKTNAGLVLIHSVRVAKDIYIELPLESGGYIGAAVPSRFYAKYRKG